MRGEVPARRPSQRRSGGEESCAESADDTEPGRQTDDELEEGTEVPAGQQPEGDDEDRSHARIIVGDATARP